MDPLTASVQERNLAQIGPVVALNRVPSTFKSWRKVLDWGDQQVSVTCTAGADDVVPHGADSDVIFALTCLYVAQGMPDHGVITVSYTDIQRWSGIKKKGDMKQRIGTSLTRIRKANYVVTNAWARKSKSGGLIYTSVEMSIIDSIKSAGTTKLRDLGLMAESPGKFTPSEMLEIRLGREFAESIRNQYTHSVNFEQLTQLRYPLARLMFRMLEEAKAVEDHHHIHLQTWALRLGLFDLSAEENGSAAGDAGIVLLDAKRIKRSLEPAHNELMRIGFLKAVEYVGRGKAAKVHYAFHPATGEPTSTPRLTIEPPPPAELVRLLTERGVRSSKAMTLARKVPEPDLRQAVAFFDGKRSAGYKATNPGGFLTSVLDNIEEYRAEFASVSAARSGAVITQQPALFEEQVNAEVEIERRRGSHKYLVARWGRKGLVTRMEEDHLKSAIDAGRFDEVTFPIDDSLDSVTSFIRAHLDT